jgi:Fe-S cluster assembly protein SufD
MNLAYFKEQFDLLQAKDPDQHLGEIREQAFNTLNKLGIPGAKHEEWKYTRIAGLFNKDFAYDFTDVNGSDISFTRLPRHEKAHEIVFINGRFNAKLSSILSLELTVLPLEEAASGEFADLVKQHLGHNTNYLKDGISALNTAFLHGGVFLHVATGQVVVHPVYIYNITDARSVNTFAQPRTLVYVSENAEVKLVETFQTLGDQESFTNQVTEIVVEKDGRVEHYKIQQDAKHASQVSTTHIRQIGKSFAHSVTISLDGNIVRNNLNMVMEAAYCESHMYGLYFISGKCHVDNHTVVDNVQPNCYSNELYKGIMTGSATGVFNGKIFVRQDAQKTNAYQSNKNVLLSSEANVNTKPQLEIFADDVKCSHGCTVGRLDEEGLFYLRSRGVPEKAAQALLLHGFAIDILDKIRLEPIREYVDHLISERLELI